MKFLSVSLQAKLRVYNSKWTQSFSLDTVASNGVIVCKDKERNRKYQVKHTTKVLKVLRTLY